MKIKVRVIPRAKKQRIEEFDQGLKVYLNEPALLGKANSRLVEVLAAYFKTKKRNITIVSGLKQRDKIIEISEDK
ncbi:MAG: DUF167 domain-containing protein [Candidatus Omnitrophica bacterium]|nr:DUF167 domain-containing protein [Candidatus Omnitrophota bacterium]